VANLARRLDVDPEAALRGTNGRFEARFRRMEALAAARGRDLRELDLEAQDALWDEAKTLERDAL
jgi:nucleoside triphosphate diphosphatase